LALLRWPSLGEVPKLREGWAIFAAKQTTALRKLFFILGFSFLILYSSAQTDSLQACDLQISLLTCSPGEELYSTFGHTAIRVKNAANGSDIVFNYGTFEFSPEFYTQFIQGKLLYYLSIDDYSNFIQQYNYEKRSIAEQVLRIDCAAKEALHNALMTNAQEQNRYYRYDFLFDNCTTRAGDIIAKNSGAPVVFKNILPKETPTFRNLLHHYLDSGGQYWSRLGIDILLGPKLDKKVTNRQAMFLPDYLLKGFDSATVNGQKLVTPAQVILPNKSPLNKGSLFRPSFVFFLLLIIASLLTFNNYRNKKKVLRIFDTVFFLLLGLAGLLLLFMWFGTDHYVCRYNFNLLWALPTNLVAAFVVHSGKVWVKTYFKVVFWISSLLLATWFFLPQQMNDALIPLVIIILIRSWFLSKKQNNAGERANA
jgi:hypothetical protein